MDWDALLLSRIQFAFTIAFHILFPSLTFGLALFLVLVEGAWLWTRDQVYFRLYRFWVKIFALAFGLGVVTGIVMSFQFGTNWSRFSFVAGEVIGPLHGYEVLTAFFLEAGFLGVMLFGWRRVGPGVHFAATCLVALGTLTSTFWILSANSWMQTPAGYTIAEDGRVLVESWTALIFNPSFPYRMGHMVIAGFMASCFVVIGVSAWLLLKERHMPIARPALSIGLWVALLLTPAQVIMGDLHGLNTLEHQPTKVAAIEANWETRSRMPLVFFAWPDEDAEQNFHEWAVPGLGSWILTRDADGVVPGLKDVPRKDRPPVAIVFWAFRLMVGIGFVLLGVALAGLALRGRGRYARSRPFLWVCVLAGPLGFVAILAGWTVTEVGRQPWVIYGLQRTADAVTPTLTTGQVAWSLALFVFVYNLLLVLFLYFLAKVIRKGPDYAEPTPTEATERDRRVGVRTSWLPTPGSGGE